MNNTLRVLILYLGCLIVGQGFAIALGLFADQYSAAAGIAVFIPVYYAMYWVAWRAALWIGDREPAAATADADRDGRPPLTAALMLLAPAALTLELCD